MSQLTKDKNEAENATNEKKPFEDGAADSVFKRRVVAITVGAVVLLAVLIILMCYQLIKIGVERNKVNQLKSDIATLEQELENGEITLEIRRQYNYIEKRARQMGYHYVTDK